MRITLAEQEYPLRDNFVTREITAQACHFQFLHMALLNQAVHSARATLRCDTMLAQRHSVTRIKTLSFVVL